MVSDRYAALFQRVNRRALVKAGIAAPAVSTTLLHVAHAQDATPSPAEMLEQWGKDTDLINYGSSYEMPIVGYDEFLTPNSRFFIRANGPMTVDIPEEEWILSITGLVDEELEFSIADLKGMETHTITAWVECSGNSRGRFGDDPQPVAGTPWLMGGIGNAEWEGVRVADLLNQAGVQDGAVDMVSYGADFDEMQRGLPISKALDPNTMIVWSMNGEAIPNVNGGPLRLLVPGWGGIASTKWIKQLEIIDHEFQGHFNNESYVIVDENGVIVRPVREMGVKSMITSHGPDESVEAGDNTVFGYAWSGYGGVVKVEFSADGGETWEEAEITQEAGPYSWVRFETQWAAKSGDAVLVSRATDARALSQPADVAWNEKGYLMNALYPIPVTVS